jgi:hypothetical protein
VKITPIVGHALLKFVCGQVKVNSHSAPALVQAKQPNQVASDSGAAKFVPPGEADGTNRKSIMVLHQAGDKAPH